jgi:hypothetical protein
MSSLLTASITRLLAGGILAFGMIPVYGQLPEAAVPTAEWAQIAPSLEQRLSRMLPCDPRIQAAIEEVSRASDSRITLLENEGKQLTVKSQQQSETLRQWAAQQEPAVDALRAWNALSEQERADLQSQSEVLAEITRRSAAFSAAAKSLEELTQSSQYTAAMSAKASTDAAGITSMMNDWLAASLGWQHSIDLYLKSLSEEGQRWRSFYAARIARARAECAITDPAAAKSAEPAKPPARKATKRKKAEE